MKIEFAYISPEIKATYEKFGGFINEDKIQFLGFKINGEWITGIHMRGGLYGQVSKHFLCCGYFSTVIDIPKKFHRFISNKNKVGYCGLHATNIASGAFKLKKYKQAKSQKEQDEFFNYCISGNPLFSYIPNSEIKIEGTEIDYESSRNLPFN